MPIYSDIDIELTKQTDGDITKNEEFEAIQNSLKNIFTTKKGSRRMLPTFGCNLENYLFEPIDEVTSYAIGEEILSGLIYWEPRIEVKKIKIIPLYDSWAYEINITYTILTELDELVRTFKYILKKA